MASIERRSGWYRSATATPRTGSAAGPVAVDKQKIVANPLRPGRDAASGAHPKAIQTRMGHSSIRVTLDRYGHLLPGLDQAIASSFGNELRTARDRRSSTVVHGDFAATA